MANTAVHDESHAGSALSSTLWIAAAFIAMFSVLIINGRPLFYFDTVGYISQGTFALDKLGIGMESPLSKRNAAAKAKGEDHAARPETTEINAAHTVDGSRSAPYAMLAGLLARLGVLEGLIALNALAVMLAVWLPMRVAQRRLGLHVSLAQMVCLPIIVASLGSLPFFVAYLMPDTLAPVLILSIATLTVFGRSMTLWELLLAVGLGSFAVVSHLSHLAIAALLVPVAILASLLLSRKGWWMPPAFVLVILGIGFAEQSMLRSAAREVSNSQVIIKPYVTARLIQDGPGYAYLERTCPDANEPTCMLYDALQMSDDPYRLTATHIVFQKDERLGSFRLLPPADQKIVAEDQVRFFFSVLTDAPIDTTLAFVRNMLTQSYWVSVEMTLPDDAIVAQNAGVTGLVTGEFERGRLARNLDWFGPVTTMQNMLYAVSLLVTVALLLWPGSVPSRIKALVVVLLLGILANALVCGGISQPATRFGARVIWLLPLGATILVLFFRRGRQFHSGAGL